MAITVTAVVRVSVIKFFVVLVMEDLVAIPVCLQRGLHKRQQTQHKPLRGLGKSGAQIR